MSEVTIVGQAVVGGSLDACGSGDGPVRWEVSLSQSGPFSQISGYTGVSFSLHPEYGGKWVRCAMLVGGQWIPSESVRIGKRSKGVAKVVGAAEDDGPSESEAPTVRKGLRKVYRVDAGTFVKRGY